MKTPFYEKHLVLGAQIVDFHGWSMPIQYQGIVAEHLAVRNNVGLFDVSHMGVIEVSGEDAYSFVQRLITNNLDKIEPGRALYSPMCNRNGGIVDDLIVYMFNKERLILIVNASNADKDYQWILSTRPVLGVKITNCSNDFALLAIQGPLAAVVVEDLIKQKMAGLKRFHFMEINIDNHDLIIARTGYTGEDGFEILIAREAGVWLWEQLFKSGAAFGLQPIGLGARDTLRLEKGFLLYGNDMDDNTDPLEAGIGWAVDLSKADFIGKEALVQKKQEGLKRKFVFIEVIDRGIPRAGCLLRCNGEVVGKVTSGTFSPSQSKGVALGYVAVQYANIGQEITIEIRGRVVKAEITRIGHKTKETKENVRR